MSHFAVKEVFQFDELNAKAKEKARDWWREGAFHYEWWDCTFEDAKHMLKLCGFTVEDIYFSGFWSQGDGACFKGGWSASDVMVSGVSIECSNTDVELCRVAAGLEVLALKYPGAGMSVVQRGHYSHRFCTDFTTWLGTRDVVDLPGQYSHEEDIVDEEAEKEIIELSRDAMLWIYRRLEEEYDYQNADEQVNDTIRANEYEFTEDGARYRY